MKIHFKEPPFARYLHLDSQNKLHLIMPFVNGYDIGLENTCQLGFASAKFWGYGDHMNSPDTVKKVLLAYQEALRSDLLWPGIDETIIQLKKERLQQIDVYLEALNIIEQSQKLSLLNGVFPGYPEPLKKMLQGLNSNLYSIVLRPTKQDSFLRSETLMPLFSVGHDSQACGEFDTVSVLQQTLIKHYQRLVFRPQDVKTKLIERVLAQEFDHSNLALLQEALSSEVKAFLGEEIDFKHDVYGKRLEKELIDKDMEFNGSSTPQEYLSALLGYCAGSLLETIVESPYKRLTNAEQWSIATQFLLGITSLYRVSELYELSEDKKSLKVNWGRLLDTYPELSESLAETMAAAQQNNQSPEEQLLSWLNSQYSLFGLQTPLSSEDFVAIKNDFAHRYVQIKESPHFDEFLLLDTQKKGTFVMHQGSIGASFAEFAVLPGEFELPQALVVALEELSKQFKALDSVEIPHHNSFSGEYELDLSCLDNNSLEALYKQINSEEDPLLKVQLLAQLKKEKPAFNPHIDLEQFLQYVAYGAQNRAEDFLNKHLYSIQEILTASTIPFTDYSGRTFNCTAYEYAYWAKDSHMCRMLEKYMDAHTAQLVLEQIRLREELVQGAALFPQRLRGFTYIKKGKEYKSAHFDLRPLINALQHYVDEYDKNPDEPDEERIKVLNKIWVEEVGRAQLDVPAHIIHEYCHSPRDFNKLNKNQLDASVPTNLRRDSSYYNWNTNKYEFWFRPELRREAVAILRGDLVGCQGRCVTKQHWSHIATEARIDLAALKMIDKVRTAELKQSLANLELLSLVQNTAALISN